MNPRTILIVTESPQIASIVTTKLERDGMRVSWQKDGERCLAFLTAERPDLIILESVLPDRSGFQLFEEIYSRDRLRAVPVFVLLDVMQDKTEADFLEAGAAQVFIKPFRPTVLSKKIRKTLSIENQALEPVTTEKE